MEPTQPKTNGLVSDKLVSLLKTTGGCVAALQRFDPDAGQDFYYVIRDELPGRIVNGNQQVVVACCRLVHLQPLAQALLAGARQPGKFCILVIPDEGQLVGSNIGER